jgi:hypothetical protein
MGKWAGEQADLSFYTNWYGFRACDRHHTEGSIPILSLTGSPTRCFAAASNSSNVKEVPWLQ